jgi:hypothetical protein
MRRIAKLLPVWALATMAQAQKKNQEEITATLVKEFNWGTGPATGNIPGMMQELR